MNSSDRKGKLQLLFYALAIIGAAAVAYSAALLLFTGREAPAAQAQTDAFLDRRINQIEQRFYTVESRITRLEQEFRMPAIAPGAANNNDVEIRLLRSQVETLNLRVAELECALLTLDERTLTEAARRARNQSGAAAADPCRKGSGAPVKLSARP